MNDYHAVFAVCFFRKTSLICATTRPDGSIGLPGGKVDYLDTDIFATVIREAREEGWNLTATREIMHVAIVDGKKIGWIRCTTSQNPLVKNHKEKSRGIMPIAVPIEMVANQFGNQFLLTKYPDLA